MSPTAAFPVNTLTEIQALDELAAIMDARPGDEDPLEVIHWQQTNSHRAQQLEQHILHLQQHPRTEDAPPQQLQPEPEQEPTVSNPNQEKVREALAELIDVTAMANFAHDRGTFKTLQQRSANLRFKIRDKCRKHGITEPELPAPPVNPFLVAAPEPDNRPKVVLPPTPDPILPPFSEPALTPHQRLVAEECEERSQTIASIMDMQEPGLESPALPKAGPGPYTCSPEEIRAELARQQHHVEASAADLDFCDHLGIAPPPDGPGIGREPLDAEDRRWLGFAPPAPPTAQDRADRIRRDLTALLPEIDALEDRQSIRPWLDAIEARIQMCYLLAEEPALGEVG